VRVPFNWLVTLIPFVALASTLACGGKLSEVQRSPEEQQAIDVALAAARGEGIITAAPERVSAIRMSYAQAERDLTGWGASFPGLPNPPSPQLTVWIVTLIGPGSYPGPDARYEDCLDFRVIVEDGAREELGLFGKRLEEC